MSIPKPSNDNYAKSPHPVRLRRLAMNPKMDPNRRDYALALADVIEGFDKRGIKSLPPGTMKKYKKS